MSRCPHYVLHGQAEGDPNKSEVVYYHRCGLRIKEGQKEDCSHYPFALRFDHTSCDVYQQMFKSSMGRSSTIPVRDTAASADLAQENVGELKAL
ncbi:MAG: hypothetical protein OYH77_05090 [Pseudomonadota bacterium]|nr:hypothetical protein [Pseudomonadota bacterium]